MSAELVSVEDSIKQAMDEVEEKNAPELDDNADEPLEKPQSQKERDESGKFVKKAKEEKEELENPVIDPVQKPEVKTEPQEAAPQAWGAAVKAEWSKLPPTVRAEINKREQDIHRMMTSHDGELRMGRELKEVITPYMPVLQSVGVTPQVAVQNLLNNDYVLRHGSAEQKAQKVQELFQYYGLDMGQITQVQQQQASMPPEMRQMMQEIQGLKQTITQQSSLQEQQEQAKIMAEVNAFGADSKNIHFHKPEVKAAMAPLLGNGTAKNLQEAYDMACWAVPSIRTELLAAQNAEQQQKKAQEIAKKKQASASVTGSPGVNLPSSTKSSKSVEDDVREAFDDIMNSKI
jgi:hypothetical protein